MSTILPTISVPPRIPNPRPPVIADSPRIEALRDAGAAALADFWQSMERDGTPLIEKDGDHALVTFVWRERRPTHNVVALVNKMTDRSDLDRSRMRKLPGTDLWHLTYRVRDDWQASYHFAPDESSGPPRDLAAVVAGPVTDPLNPVVLPQSRPPHKSVAVAPGASPEPRWWVPVPGVPAGTTDTTTAGGRRVWRYLPPGHRASGGPYPLLVMLDGDVWGPLLPIAPVLDNLIAAGCIPPLVALLPDSVDRPTRFTEYACDAPFAEFLAGELIEVAAAGLGVTTDPARTVVAGQSLGGLMAAFAAVTRPDRFGNVLSQSGAYWWKSGTPDDHEAEWFAHRLATGARQPVRWHVEVGLDEWVNVRPNRHVRDVLLARGYPLTYAEFAGGHDRLCWRERLGDALAGLFDRG